MRLPAELAAAVGRELAACDPRALANAAERLSAAYRHPGAHRGAFVEHPVDARAYLAVRLPATFAAVRAVCGESRIRPGGRPVTDMLDLGAGPGTAGWAAADAFPGLARITAFERNKEFVRLGAALGAPGGVAAAWEPRDVTTPEPLPPHDLVVCSYVLNELDAPARDAAVARAWNATRTALAVIEPGTTAGFGIVRRARDALVRAGAHIAAPCPHAGACPMERGDWCHFAARLPRTALHRRLKRGTLEYEDEKFAYVVAAREPAEPCAARILRHPQRHGGHAGLRLCTPRGVEEVTVTRSDKRAWKRVRKAGWGDAWEL